MKNKFINKESKIRGLYIKERNNNIEITIQETINYKWYNTKFFVNKEELENWMMK